MHNYDQFMKILHGKNYKTMIMVKLKRRGAMVQTKGHNVSLSHHFEDYINEEEC
jgi:hypothetical protein